jgi:site-specific DNA recombinase
MAKRAACYCRVSSEGQEEKGYSLEEQIRRTQEHCVAQGWEVVRVWREVHTGHELDERPQMRDLQKVLKARAFDVLVVTDVDRLARNANHQEVLLYQLAKYDAELLSLDPKQQFDDSAAGRHMMHPYGFIRMASSPKLNANRSVCGRS